MGLTAQQLTYLKTADQRFRAKVGLFPSYAPVITPPTIVAVTGQPLAPLPMPMCTPRHALVAYGATIDLYGRDSYNRGGAYVGNANIAFTNTGGAGSLTDNGDGTATWTAPGSGSGTNLITVTVTNTNGSSTGNIYLQYPDTINDAIVAEVASISGSVDQHYWKLTFRVRGDASGFVPEAGILLHVEDTWAGTTSTFGGYHYAEGVFFGYITQTQYFEDAFGNTWLGVECSGPWSKLTRTKVGETWWGTTAASGRFWMTGFAPVDAIWHFVTQITDFAKYHNCTFFFDTNSIMDLIIEESDLSTIFDDVMARTLCTAWTDRYGSLMCIPDPDVRAAEWWGTPSPVFDSAGAGPLTENYVSDYQINVYPYQQRKLSMEALDSSKLGMWAISENTASSLGSVDRYPGKLICDDPMTLAQWVSQVRAKNNRKWDISVDRFLDHTVDLMNFVDVNFTSPTQTNGTTASGRAWISNINYRPDVWGGGWQGRWELLKNTSADVDGSSAWGGTGQYWGGVPGFTGSAPVSSWGPTASVSSYCHIFDFVNSGTNGWILETGVNGGNPLGQYVAGKGFSAKFIDYDVPNVNSTGSIISIKYNMGKYRYFASATVWYSGVSVTGNITYVNRNPFGGAAATGFGGASGNLGYSAQTNIMPIDFINESGVTGVSKNCQGVIVMSARICGSGADPFGNLISGTGS